MSEHQSAPTRQDLEKLKSDWARDPCWDIEDTEGFESFRDELLAFSEQKTREWDREKEVFLMRYAEHHGVTADAAREMQGLEARVRCDIESSAASLGYLFREAGVQCDNGALECLLENIVGAAVAKVRFLQLQAGSPDSQETNRD